MSSNNLISGYLRFVNNLDKSTITKYKELSLSQSPTALLITCIDARILPEQLFRIEPGQIFCLRNIANLVAPEGQEPSTESAIKFAVIHMGIKDIIVMGHSSCLGIECLINGSNDTSINSWLKPWQSEAKKWPSDDIVSCQKQAVIASARNIRKMSFVDESVNIHAWHLDIAKTTIQAYNPSTGSFELLKEE